MAVDTQHTPTPRAVDPNEASVASKVLCSRRGWLAVLILPGLVLSILVLAQLR